jgi:hypothetical protein
MTFNSLVDLVDNGPYNAINACIIRATSMRVRGELWGITQDLVEISGQVKEEVCIALGDESGH